jgi:hypothetical protein
LTRPGIDIGWPLWNVCVTNDHGYVLLVVSTSRSFPRSWFITGFVTRLTRRVPLVDRELLIRPEQMRSPPGFSSYFSIFSFMCMFYRSLVVLLYLFFCQCVVCFSSIYGFWLPLWYIQARLTYSRRTPLATHPSILVDKLNMI